MDQWIVGVMNRLSKKYDLHGSNHQKMETKLDVTETSHTTQKNTIVNCRSLRKMASK